jgi:cell division protein FtsL
MNVRQIAIAISSAALVATSLGVVYTKHQSRKLFVNLQALQDERDQLNIEWGRLLLEQSTWATPTRVEAMARQRLGMRVPESDQLVIVTP